MPTLLKKNETTPSNQSNYIILTKDSVLDENGNLASLIPKYYDSKSTDYTIQSSDLNQKYYFTSDNSIKFTLPDIVQDGDYISFLGNNNTLNIVCHSSDSFYYKGSIKTNILVEVNEYVKIISKDSYWYVITNSTIKNGYFDNNKCISNTISIDNTGMAWAWGYNNNGSLGDNSITCKSTPVRVCCNITFCQISVGVNHSLGIDNTGMAWSWGYNANGQLGDNSTTNRSTPIRVCCNITFCQISAGYQYSIGIDNTGMAWSWGYNANGRLGDNSTTNRSTPIRVCGDITFCQIRTAYSHSLGIDNTGMAWSWGYNNHGQLGDNSITSKSTPVRVCCNITFCQIAGSEPNSFGIDNTGMAWAWGFNYSGSLGDNTTISKRTPVRVCCNITFCQIVAGGSDGAGTDFVIGLDNTGMAWGWGIGGSGQLGNNIGGNKSTPVRVCGDISFNQITIVLDTGGSGIDNTGMIWSWGDNSYGQLGDNSIIRRLTPIRVLY